MIELTGVATGFGRERISENVDLSVRDGEILSLIGPNGCGKTTLLKTLSCMIRPLAGSVLIDGRDSRELSPRELARHIAFLPQLRGTPNISVRALVSHGRFPHLSFSRRLTAYDRERVDRALELTGVQDWSERNLQALSGGERQRVYIAMTIAQDTPLVVWDEPTTYLDINYQYEILELASRLNREGCSIAMSLHDISGALTYSHRVCVMGPEKQIRMVDAPAAVYAAGAAEEVFGVASRAVDIGGGRVGYLFYSRGAGA